MSGRFAARMTVFVLSVLGGWAWVVIVGNGLVGLWVLLAHWFRPLRRPAAWTFVIAAQAAVVVQVVTGIYLRSAGGLPVRNFHVFYGAVSVIAVALGYLYAKGSEWVEENRWLFFGLLELFLMGLGIRAYLQAP